tara:strand:+ start:599 stop:2065 length:1467 start_codon:yes stop_codon:yes gene_type:complete
MLNQLFKNENFDIKNPLTILIIFFLLSLIVVSKYYYRRLTIENNQNMFDSTKGFNELLEQYASKYESVDTQISPNIYYSIDTENIETDDLYLRDFYIKSSFNSCVIDPSSKFVSAETLPFLLNRGVRFFDFQIFSVTTTEGPIPVVGVNIHDNGDITMTSTNYVPLAEVLNVLSRTMSNQPSDSPGYNTPYYLHLRIYTTITETLNQISELIKQWYDNLGMGMYKLLKNGGQGFYDPRFPPQKDEYRIKRKWYRGMTPVTEKDLPKDTDVCKKYKIKHRNGYETIGDITLKTYNNWRTPWTGKLSLGFFILDIDDSLYESSDLKTNWACYNYKEARFQKYSAEEIINTSRDNEIIKFNQTGFTLVYPDPPIKPITMIENASFPVRDGVECSEDTSTVCYPKAMNLGCQFMPMVYSADIYIAEGEDSITSIYDTMFSKMKSCYILKESDLRYFPEFIAVLEGIVPEPKDGWRTRKDLKSSNTSYSGCSP